MHFLNGGLRVYKVRNKSFSSGQFESGQCQTKNEGRPRERLKNPSCHQIMDTCNCHNLNGTSITSIT